MLFRPDNLPVVVLIVPFVLLFAALYSLWSLVYAVWLLISGGKSLDRYRQLGFVVCLSSVLLLILQSLGQLSLRDVVTLIAIVALGYLYAVRARVGLSRQR